MPEVFNWQLNRKMEYQYDEARPKRQIAYIFDPNKCIACQTCTIACKQTWTWGAGQEYMLWNNVETKPYGFYPTGWDVMLNALLGDNAWQGDTYQGETIFESAGDQERVNGWLPDQAHWAHPNLGEDEPTGLADQGTYIPETPHDMWFYYMPRICNHCTYPGCLAACPRQAIYKREEDGIVLVDQDRCRGYQECARGCPYKKVFFNNETRVSEKCIGCYPKIEEGLQPQCVVSCIGRIRMMGFISPPGESDPTNPMDYLIKERKIALPMYPQAGTEPNVYYIPPVHVDPSFLQQMFGPGVERAILNYRNTKTDEHLLGLMMLFGSTEHIIHSFDVVDGIAYGYDDKGKELVHVPLQEPTFIREYFDQVHETYLQNVT
jgi:nitrate reductase / nitrite oxidoreductase, beta subunit